MLGGLLIDAAAWDQVGDVVVADDFYRPDHRLIFDGARRAESQRQARPTSSRFPSSSSATASSKPPAGSPIWARWRAIRRPLPTCARYAQIVRERSLLRRLIEAGRAIAASVFATTDCTARDLVDRCRAAGVRDRRTEHRSARRRREGQRAAADADRQDRSSGTTTRTRCAACRPASPISIARPADCVRAIS